MSSSSTTNAVNPSTPPRSQSQPRPTPSSSSKKAKKQEEAERIRAEVTKQVKLDDLKRLREKEEVTSINPTTAYTAQFDGLFSEPEGYMFLHQRTLKQWTATVPNTRGGSKQEYIVPQEDGTTKTFSNIKLLYKGDGREGIIARHSYEHHRQLLFIHESIRQHDKVGKTSQP